MKPLASILCLMAFLFSIACSEESFIADYDYSLSYSGHSPEARVTIHNHGSARGPHQWLFGEGANVSESQSRYPDPVMVEKAGEFFVTLKVTSGDTIKTIVKSIIIPGNTILKTIADVEFSRTSGPSSGRCYSVRQERMYKDSEINSVSGKHIDFVFHSRSPSVNFFASPHTRTPKFYVPGGRKSILFNNAEALGITSAILQQAETDSFFPSGDLASNGSGTAFGDSAPYVTLFVLNDGRKGAILVKEIKQTSIIADIKVQKYLP